MNTYRAAADRRADPGSANFVWGPRTRAEEGDLADPYDLANPDYGRFVRWGQLKAQYYGRIDVEVGKAMIADTYDAYLGRNWPGGRTICGESEHATPGVDPNGSMMADPNGSLDGKVSTVAMAQNGLQAWACWGHPSGNRFDVDLFLADHPLWRNTYGPFRVFGLATFAAAGPNPWTLLSR